MSVSSEDFLAGVGVCSLPGLDTAPCCMPGTVSWPLVLLSSERTTHKSWLSAAGLYCALHCIRCM